MNTHDHSDALIDLGSASTETQGFIPVATDSEGVGLQQGMLTDD